MLLNISKSEHTIPRSLVFILVEKKTISFLESSVQKLFLEILTLE